MNDIFVERHWDQPQTEAGMQELMAAAESCLGIHRVRWCGSLLAADGRDLFCHFRGADAESVRIAMRQAGEPRRIWACRVEDAADVVPADLDRANVVVVHDFDEPADFGARRLLDEVDMGCFRIHRVRLVRSYLSADRRRMACLYQAPDAESVRLAQREAGLPADRVWAVRRYAP